MVTTAGNSPALPHWPCTMAVGVSLARSGAWGHTEHTSIHVTRSPPPEAEGGCQGLALCFCRREGPRSPVSCVLSQCPRGRRQPHSLRGSWGLPGRCPASLPQHPCLLSPRATCGFAGWGHRCPQPLLLSGSLGALSCSSGCGHCVPPATGMSIPGPGLVCSRAPSRSGSLHEPPYRALYQRHLCLPGLMRLLPPGSRCRGSRPAPGAM